MSKALRLKVSDNPEGNSTLAAKISHKDAKQTSPRLPLYLRRPGTQRFKDKEGFKHDATEISSFPLSHRLSVSEENLETEAFAALREIFSVFVAFVSFPYCELSF
jgi:hypothetical protein